MPDCLPKIKGIKISRAGVCYSCYYSNHADELVRSGQHRENSYTVQTYRNYSRAYVHTCSKGTGIIHLEGAVGPRGGKRTVCGRGYSSFVEAIGNENESVCNKCMKAAMENEDNS